MSIRMRIYDIEDKAEELKNRLSALQSLIENIKNSPSLPGSLLPEMEKVMSEYLEAASAINELTNLYREILEAKADDESLLEEAANLDDISKSDVNFLKKFIDLISENMDNEHAGADFYASKLALSRSTLFRRMKELTGMNINEFIRNVKLDKSREFLRSGQYTVGQVATMVGINSISYFRSLFKATYGISTGEYIRHNT